MPGWPAQVHVTATLTWTSGRRHSGQPPAASRITAGWSGHIHAAARRTGTSVILHRGHDPGRDSTTSGCIGQVIETGGSGRTGVTLRCAAPVAASSVTPITVAMQRNRPIDAI